MKNPGQYVNWPGLKLLHVQQGMGEPRAIIQAKKL
jgi:hypothetical protein